MCVFYCLGGVIFVDIGSGYFFLYVVFLMKFIVFWGFSGFKFRFY